MYFARTAMLKADVDGLGKTEGAEEKEGWDWVLEGHVRLRLLVKLLKWSICFFPYVLNHAYT